MPAHFDLDEYQRLAKTTARYPNAGSNFTYPVLGLAGESGEVAEKLTALNVDSSGLHKEIGDVLWYAAVLADELGFSLTCVNELTPDLPEATSGRSDVYLGLALAATSGAVAERVKKVMRDHGGVMDDITRTMIAARLSGVLVILDQLAQASGTTLETIARANLAKLASRARRNLLSGEGDNR